MTCNKNISNLTNFLKLKVAHRAKGFHGLHLARNMIRCGLDASNIIKGCADTDNVRNKNILNRQKIFPPIIIVNHKRVN